MPVAFEISSTELAQRLKMIPFHFPVSLQDWSDRPESDREWFRPFRTLLWLCYYADLYDMEADSFQRKNGRVLDYDFRTYYYTNIDVFQDTQQ